MDNRIDEASNYICNALSLLLTAKDMLPEGEERTELISKIAELDVIRHKFAGRNTDAPVNS